MQNEADESDEAERSIRKMTRPSHFPQAAEAITGAAAGAVIGVLGGPIGAIAGAAIGGAIGAAAGEVLSREDHKKTLHDEEIDSIDFE